MTNTEAIETLRANYPDSCFEQLREAVDAAIVALKAQNTSGDTISRQAAIDVLEERLQANGYSNTALVSELNRSIGYLMRLPSAERLGRWLNVEHAPNGLLYATCSVCGKRQTVESVNYCGNCGARMEVE